MTNTQAANRPDPHHELDTLTIALNELTLIKEHYADIKGLIDWLDIPITLLRNNLNSLELAVRLKDEEWDKGDDVKEYSRVLSEMTDFIKELKIDD